MFALAVSAAGRVCWEAPLTHPGLGAHVYSPPYADEGRVYLTSDDQIQAFTLADGHHDWSWGSDAPVQPADGRGYYTISASDGVLVTDGARHGSPAAVLGIDERTGIKRWQRAEPPENGDGPISTGEGQVLFNTFDGHVSEVLNDLTGAVLWQHLPPPVPAVNAGGIATPIPLAPLPVIVGDSVVGVRTDRTVGAVSLRTGAFLWQDPGPVGLPMEAGPVVLLTSPSQSDTRATAVDPATGHVLWHYGVSNFGGVQQLGGALIYLDTVNGGLARIDPTTGTNQWQLPVNPVVEAAAGADLVSLEGKARDTPPYYLVGRDLVTGAPHWQFAAPITTPAGQDPNAQLLSIQGAAGPVVVLVVRDIMTAYDASTGAVVWRLSLPSDTFIDGTVVVDGGFVVQSSGEQYAVQGH